MKLGEAVALLRHYDLDVSGIRRFADGINNRSFHVASRAGPQFVLTELLLHDEETASALADTIDHMRSYGILVGEVVADQSGRRIVSGPRWPCLLTRFLQGTIVSRAAARPVAKMAETLFAVHRVPPAAHFAAGARRLPPNWADLLGGHDCPDLRRAIADVAEFAAELDQAGDAVTIHGDAFCDNLVLRPDGRLGVLDWEYAGRDARLLDLAVAASGLLAVNGGDWAEVEELMAEYGRVADSRLEADQVARAVRYALVLLAFHRFVRNTILLPDTARTSSYRATLVLLESVPAR